MIEDHVAYTGSRRGQDILERWESCLPHFVKVFPTEYKRALAEIYERKVMEESATPSVAAIKKEAVAAK
jgi:glutamate synthase domain-containing protein 3